MEYIFKKAGNVKCSKIVRYELKYVMLMMSYRSIYEGF